MTREIVVGIRLNSDEKALADRAAEHLGMALGTFIRTTTMPVARQVAREAEQENGNGKRRATEWEAQGNGNHHHLISSREAERLRAESF